MKKFYLIIILLAGLQLGSSAQSRTSADNGVQQTKIVKFYPNPANSFINFEFQRSYNQNYTLLIFNFIGKVVLESKNLSQKSTINLTDFYRGMYVYQLRDNLGAILESGKFQVVK